MVTLGSTRDGSVRSHRTRRTGRSAERFAGNARHERSRNRRGRTDPENWPRSEVCDDYDRAARPAEGAGIYGCQATVDMFGLEEKDFVPQVTGVLTVGEFYELAAGGEIVFT